MYLGKMIEVTREAPANLGTAMKTIIARFEDMKKDPAALIDGASANKVEAALATIGIALRDAAGEFRPLQDVFDELGMKWKDLTRNQQAYIATVAAGSRQQSRFLAMMNNYPRTLELIRESQNSAGAALKQYETYQDSAAAASARLTASWEKFYSKVANSKMIVDVINNLTRLVEVMNKIGPAWTTAIATISAHGINKIITGDLISKAINFFGQNITSSAGKKITLTIGSVLKDGIKFGMKEAFNKFEPGDFEGFKNAFAAAGQEGAKGLLSGIGKIGIKIGELVPELLIISGIIAAILIAVKAISEIIEYNNKAVERELLASSKLAKEDIERYEKSKKEKNIIEDNYKAYKKYEDVIILTEEELKEQNAAVDAIKEQYEDLVIITDEYGRKIINNTDDLNKYSKKLKEDTKELERQVALNKLIAVQQSESSEKKYGKGNKTFMQDWTVEQLTNSGFNLEEAEILDAYGEMYRNKNKKGGTFWDFAGAAFNFGNKEYLNNDSLYNQIVNDLIGTGKFNWGTRGEFTNPNSKKGKQIAEAVEAIQNNNKEDLEKITNVSLASLDEEAKAFMQIIQKYAQIALDAQKILERPIKDFAKSTLISTIDEIDYGLKDSFLQNDAFNLYSNLSSFNNNSFIEELIGDETDTTKIEGKMKEIGKAINDYINNLNPADQKSFHDLTEKLLDPSLSPNKKHDLIEKFRKDADGISAEVEKILNQYVEGTNFDIKRREKLSNSLGIDSQFLRQFNSNQLRIIDQFRTANKNTKGKNAFDLGAYIQTDAGVQMLKLLDRLETDITKDPTIYKRAQNIMVNFFKDNFALKDKEAFDVFQEMFGNFPELAMEAAENNFFNAKSLILTEPTKALNKKQTEEYQQLEGILGESLRDYIAINEQGEEYLTVAGKIAIFEKTAQDYRNTLIAEGDNYISQIEQIFAISEKNEKGEALLTKEQEKQIKNLEQEIELNSKRIEQLDKIKEYTTQVTAETANISMAKGYSDNLKVFKQAEDEMKKFNGVMNSDTAAAIMAMNASYAQYLNKRLVGEDYYYTISEEGLKSLRAEERKNYNLWIEEQKGKLQERIDKLEAELTYFSEIASSEYEISENFNEDEFNNRVGLLDDKLDAAETELEGEVQYEEDKNKEILTGASNTAQQFQNMWSTAYSNLRDEWNQLANAMKKGEPTDEIDFSPSRFIPKPSDVGMNNDIESTKKPSENKPPEDEPTPENETKEQRIKRIAQEQVDRLNEVLERLRAAQNNLVPLGPELEDVSKSGSKTSDEMKKLTKVLEGLTDALEDLDKLLKDVKVDLDDISVDYNPFTDLFEAWEHEWDYYYNIKRLIAEISTQGQFIDNIISADYVSADKRVQAYHAKIGNLLAQMSANDAYIESLRTGMSQNAVELMKEFGDYYKVDPNTGQIYQTDKNLTDINETINQTGEEIYNLQKLQSEKENNLALEEAKLDALEQEKSAYEEILSTIESQIDSLKDSEDITVDLSELESKRDTIKADIEVSEDSIEAAKDKINGMEDEIQEIEIQITLKEKLKDDLENYVDRMEDKVSEYEEYWENLNSTIAEQQELLQNLTEIYNTYIDTAISTQQDLYNAIVENYQREIDNKKKEYDELKQLDNDYLASVKDNISKERQAREDNKKQRSYQQSLQRAQLLQMDTSGAFRTELNDLKNSIEQQREDLYDDLVDKQVEALEKEIEKRHELYDKEVAALEERLAYMQENAILLWEMVNEIIAQGSEAMMSTLEGTMEYINSTELSRQQQRKEWENNVKMTFDGVKNGTINMLNSLIQAGNNYITKELPEINKSLDEYNQVFINASETMNNYNAQVLESLNILKDDTKLSSEAFHSILNSFMTTWNDRTNEFTAYAQNWADITASLKQQAKKNLSDLKEFYDEEGKVREENLGSIKKYNEELERTYTEMYDDFLEERRRYRDELESLIDSIRTEIEAAVKDAADAIRNAIDSLSAGGKGDGTGEGTGEGDTPTKDEKRYRLRVWDQQGNALFSSYGTKAEVESWYQKAVSNPDLINAVPGINLIYKLWRGSEIISFLKGGLANFTGPAWLDGTASSPERVLSPHQTKLFESMVSSLERASNNSNINSALGSSYNIGDINTSIQVAKLDNQTDINQLAKQVEDKIVKTIRNRVTISV